MADTKKDQPTITEDQMQLVHRIAKHMKSRLPSSVRYEDLFQAGIVGLLEAMYKYDDSRGCTLATYASIRIRGAMIDELRKGDWAPRSVHRNARRIAEAIQVVENRGGQEARDVQIANEMGISIEDYYKMLQDSNGVRISEFDDSDYKDEDTPDISFSAHMLGPYDQLARMDFKDHLARHISKLNERERLVLTLYYDEELNLKAIGEVLGVTESRVSQIHSQAMLRLQSRMQSNERGQ